MRLIDADELKESLKDFKAESYNQKYAQGLQDAIDYYFPQIIDDMPTVDVQPVKHGRWIWVRNYRDCEGNIYSQYKCSCCDFGVGNVYSIEDLTPFCGNCGARLDKKDDDENGKY